jgi:hypothetical protein
MTPDETTEKLFAHYSAESAERQGVVVYEAADGSKVTCTCVCKHEAPTDCCRWDDLTHLGPVERFVSSTKRMKLSPNLFYYPAARKIGGAA